VHRAFVALVIVAACSDSASKPPAAASAPPISKPATPAPDAAIATVDSWIGIRIERDLWISKVFDATPAKQAGVLAGDRLVALYGEPIESAREFMAQIRRMPSGATIPLTVERRGEELKLSITTEARPPTR